MLSRNQIATVDALLHSFDSTVDAVPIEMESVRVRSDWILLANTMALPEDINDPAYKNAFYFFHVYINM